MRRKKLRASGRLDDGNGFEWANRPQTRDQDTESENESNTGSETEEVLNKVAVTEESPAEERLREKRTI
jgi:hypothetical protein